MALTYVFLASAPSAGAIALSGKSYTANSAGVITGVLPADALNLQGVAGASLQPMLATGATADRPAAQPATALTGAVNNVAPFPANSTPFYDTTLSKTVYFVGTQRSSTGWVDQAGNAA
jgi:hypothetical protein